MIDGSPKTESRHKSNANNYNGQEEIKELKMVNTLVCKHCKNEDIQGVFLPESAEDLWTSFSDVPAHLASFENKCPQSVKTKLETLKAFRPIQDALLKHGTQKNLVQNIME